MKKNSESISNDSRQYLQEELIKIIQKRRNISTRLTEVTRKDRSELLVEHREIKSREYEIGEMIATLELEGIDKSAEEKKYSLAYSKVQKLQSRLLHADWLQWTRSIWKFKEMESKARTGLHPAQFSSKVPERVIKMFSFKQDTVLDPFLGTGTTCIEAAKLNRKSIGIDINPEFLTIAKDKLRREKIPDELFQLINCDARDLTQIADESIQLIMTHPPYWNCVKISDLPNDLSNCDNNSYPQFLGWMKQVLMECYRVLQPDRVAAFMIGDVTRKVDGVTQLFPLHSDFLQLAQQIGFLPWDIYIVETKMRNSGGMPMMGSYPYPHKIFAQFAHNYLVVLRKPVANTT